MEHVKIEWRTFWLFKKADILDGNAIRLTSSASVLRWLYGMPKTHQEETPLRPTMKCIASPTHTWRSTSQFYSGRLLGNPNISWGIRSYLCRENSRLPYKVRIYWWLLMWFQCLQRFHWRILLQTLPHRFHRQTVDFMKHVLTTTYFLHVGWFYQQKNGVYIGFPWHR